MFRKLSIASGLRSASGPGKDSKQFQGKVVKYTPYSGRHALDDDDLDEVISVAAQPENVRYGSSTTSGGGSVNGPRVVPGIITSTGSDKSHVLSAVTYGAKVPPTAVPSSSGLGRRPSVPPTPPPSASTSSKAHPTVQEEHDDQRSESDLSQAFIETISSKVGSGGPSATSARTANGQRHGDAPHHHHHVRTTTTASPPTSSHGPKMYQHRPSCVPPTTEVDGQMKKMREARRKELKREFEKWDTVTGGGEKSGCNLSFVFDPSGRLCYYWSMIVSLAFLYNFWVIMYRFAFEEINERTMSTWLTLDGISDFIYILDIAVHFRTGYLDEGVLQTEGSKLRTHYMNSTMFYIDCLCLLPLDFLYLSIGFNSMFRCFRLVKIYRFWSFLDRTERHTNYPNVFRTISLSHYILVIFHWNACLYHLISIRGGFGSSDWFTGSRVEECSDVDCDYLHAFYWSTLALTTIGDLPRPRTKAEYLFLIVELVSGLFLLATVLGHVANIVTNVSAARKEFQAKLDAVKTYMRMRRVPEHLKIKVIKWFDYLWMTQKSSDEDKSVGFLPAKLKAEIAIHVHLDTLKRVEIFQNTEAGFLCALVLRLRPILFSPGDYVCRKGEVGKEMYIVNRGKLQVVTDNGKTVLATLRAGSYFGEISILNMGTAGNRRTASVKSVGYSDLFCLSKTDMWDVLKDYPAARVRLEAIAVKRLEKYRKDPLKKISMGRSRSTPGLVESDSSPGAQAALNSSGQAGGPGGSAGSGGTGHRRDTTTSASAGTLLTEDASGRGGGGGGGHQASTGVDTATAAGHVPVSDNSSSGLRPDLNVQQNVQPPMVQGFMSLGPPAFGLTPATPTALHPAGGPPQVPPMPTQYFVTLPVPGGSQWYERRTSQPQTPLEALMTPVSGGISPIPGYSPTDRSGLLAGAHFRAMSPAQSAPHLAQQLQLANSQMDIAQHLQAVAAAAATATSPSGHRTPVPGPPTASGSGAVSDSSDVLVSEIKRLRERLQSLETENATMSIKLSHQQWDVENRLAEIELQMCSERGGGGGTGDQGRADISVSSSVTLGATGTATDNESRAATEERLQEHLHPEGEHSMSMSPSESDDSERNKESII